MVKENNVVLAHYTGRLEDGSVFTTTKSVDDFKIMDGDQPQELPLGINALIPGFEKSIIGMNIGETKTFTIKSVDAYGDVSSELLFEVEKKYVPETIEVNQTLQGGPTNESIVKVVEIKEDTVVLDGNHPLAGRDLTFDVEILEIIS